jgi:uncharacterized protein YerC
LVSRDFIHSSQRQNENFDRLENLGDDTLSREDMIKIYQSSDSICVISGIQYVSDRLPMSLDRADNQASRNKK